MGESEPSPSALSLWHSTEMGLSAGPAGEGLPEGRGVCRRLTHNQPSQGPLAGALAGTPARCPLCTRLPGEDPCHPVSHLVRPLPLGGSVGRPYRASKARTLLACLLVTSLGGCVSDNTECGRPSQEGCLWLMLMK